MRTDRAKVRRTRSRRTAKLAGFVAAALIAAAGIISFRVAASLRWERLMAGEVPALRLDSIRIHGGGLHLVHGRDIPANREPAGVACVWALDADPDRYWWFAAHHAPGFWYLYIPLWAPMLLCAACSLGLIYRDYLRSRKTDCPACGYDLTGLPANPECGSAEPSSRASPTPRCPECGLASADRPQFRRRRFRRAWRIAALTACLTLALLWAASERWCWAAWDTSGRGWRVAYLLSRGSLERRADSFFQGGWLLANFGPGSSGTALEPQRGNWRTPDPSWSPILRRAPESSFVHLPLWCPMALALFAAAALSWPDRRRAPPAPDSTPPS